MKNLSIALFAFAPSMAQICSKYKGALAYLCQ